MSKGGIPAAVRRVAVLLGVAAAAAAASEPDAGRDVYLVATLDDARVLGVELSHSDELTTGVAHATLDGPGTVHLLDPFRFGPASNATLAIRLPEPRDVHGRLFLSADGGGAALDFHVEAASFSSTEREAFLRAEQQLLAERMAADLPGRAWWRHRHRAAVAALGHEPGADAGDDGWNATLRRETTDEDSLALFTGGRAIAENLQLDRMLPATPEDGDEVALDSLAGITTAEYDWASLVAGLTPATDPLAALVPEDQHAVFFPGFDALVSLADRARDLGGPILALVDDTAADSGARERVERQLGLPLDGLARLLGPRLVRSVAVTGSDPYFRTGTDVALLLQAEDVDALHGMIVARVAAAALQAEGSERTELSVGDVAVEHFGMPDRALDSYVAVLGDAVVVTNSLVQLHRLVAVARGELGALAELPEYTFFRDRYALGDEAETALLVLSDATIRRWCGPRWRIDSSRRTRAAAALAELQATLVDAPADGAGLPAELPPGLGAVTLTPRGPSSEVYGSLAFLNPIAELDLTHVSRSEAELYGRWRDGYQRNWSGVFDPIAVRLELDGERMLLDTTVRPLIASSDYRELIAISAGGEIAPGAGDPHDDALFQWTVAIDPQADWLTRETAMVDALFPDLDALSWVGSCASVFVDDSPFWDELAEAVEADRQTSLFERGLERIPVGLHVEVRSGLLLTSFLVGVRALVEQMAPGMMRWENGNWRDEPYVTMRPSERSLAEVPENAAVHYVASGQGLLVTPDEDLLRRALDRRIARRAAAAGGDAVAGDAAASDAAAGDTAGEPVAAPVRAGLGRHVQFRMSGLASARLERLTRAMDDDAGLRRRSFDNLPILNEWKRLHPDEDPVGFHQRTWHERLTCPGGGEYRWNEEWQTMESSVYGHPLAPRDGPVFAPIVQRIRSFGAGLTFEDDGLRARVELDLLPR